MSLLLVIEIERIGDGGPEVMMEYLFSAKSCYLVLSQVGRGPFPFKFLPKSHAPFKVAFFLWLVFWDKVITMDHLISRGLHMPNRCLMCLHHVDSVSHLFIHCRVAASVWSFLLSRFHLHWVTPRLMSDLIWLWSNGVGRVLSGKANTIWSCVPFAVFLVPVEGEKHWYL